MKIVKLAGVRVLKPITQEHLRVMIPGFRIGDADSDFLTRILQHIKTCPPNERPHVIFVPGLIYDNHGNSTIPLSQQKDQVGRFIQKLEKMGITAIDKI